MVTPTLQINDQKTVFTSRKRLRRVTGLVLTSDRKISIGRGKKRLLKGMVFKLLRGQLDLESANQLRGWVAYVRSVEPEFIAALQLKYKIDLAKQFELFMR